MNLRQWVSGVTLSRLYRWINNHRLGSTNYTLPCKPVLPTICFCLLKAFLLVYFTDIFVFILIKQPPRKFCTIVGFNIIEFWHGMETCVYFNIRNGIFNLISKGLFSLGILASLQFEFPLIPLSALCFRVGWL